jgi:hypothetical protein
MTSYACCGVFAHVRRLPIEMWSNAFDKKIDGKDYRSVRICSTHSVFNTGASTTCYKYTVWCIPTLAGRNYRELYDVTADPGEINNR